MKTLIQTLFFFLLITQICFAQWYQQTSGTTTDLTSIRFVNQNDGWVVGFDGTILKTTDGGINWSLQTNIYSQNLYSVSFPDLNNGWAVGADGIILNTTDGGISWTLQPSGTGRYLTGVWFVDNNFGWAVGGLGTILNTTNGGLTWNLNNLSNSWFETIFFVDLDYGWIAGQDGTILHTTNGGSTWSVQTSGITDWLCSIHFVDHNFGWAVGGWGVLIKTTDGGNNWINVQCPLNNFTRSIFFINQNVGWIGGWSGITYEGSILNSIDGGYNWTYQGMNFGDMIRSISFIDPNIGWAAGNSGTIINTLMGGTPIELTSFIASVNKNNITLYWITASETNNAGFETQRMQENLNWERIGFVQGHGTTTEPRSYLYIDENVTTGTYKYRLKQIDFDGSFTYSNEIEVEVDFTPKEFVLYQNYPNPYNPITTIKYQNPKQAFITLKIYDVLGNEIATLVNEEKQIGSYEVEFDATELPSGIYFYQLNAGDFVQTKKMLLMK